MMAKCISSNRERIIEILQRETGCMPVHHLAPDFTVTVGDFNLRRDGIITVENKRNSVFNEGYDDYRVIDILTELGLLSPMEQNSTSETGRPDVADELAAIAAEQNSSMESAKLDISDNYPSEGTVRNNYLSEGAERNKPGKTGQYKTYEYSEAAGTGQNKSIAGCQSVNNDAIDNTVRYSMDGHTGRSLLNLICIISARGKLINQALKAKGTFYVDHEFMEMLLMHPPVTKNEFLQAIYGYEEDYGGVLFTRSYITFTGFRRCPQNERHIQKQLADHIMQTVIASQWIRPYTKNVRNKKYAFRTWLNQIGMTGEEYAEAREVMLDRLYGKSAERGIERGNKREAD